VHVRERGLEPTQDERQDVGRDRGRRAELELADPAFPELAQELRALCERADRALGVRAERAALGREPHPARSAGEELHAELALEVLDSRRQRRLGDEEHGRGLADRPALRDRQERLHLGEEHGADINAVDRRDREIRFVVWHGSRHSSAISVL
jgi:hypothetical protein